MKAAVRSKFKQLFPGVVWEYFIIENPYARVRSIVLEDVAKREVDCYFGSRQVTRQEAREFIEENDLVIAYETEDGIIWDSRDKAFQSEFKIDSRLKRDSIDSFWNQ